MAGCKSKLWSIEALKLLGLLAHHFWPIPIWWDVYFGRPFSRCRASGRSEHTGVYDHLMPFVHRHIRDGILNGSYPLHPLTVAVAMPPPRTTRYLPQVKLFTGKRVPSALGWDQSLLKLSYQPSTGTTGIPHHDWIYWIDQYVSVFQSFIMIVIMILNISFSRLCFHLSILIIAVKASPTSGALSALSQVSGWMMGPCLLGNNSSQCWWMWANQAGKMRMPGCFKMIYSNP